MTETLLSRRYPSPNFPANQPRQAEQSGDLGTNQQVEDAAPSVLRHETRGQRTQRRAQGTGPVNDGHHGGQGLGVFHQVGPCAQIRRYGCGDEGVGPVDEETRDD